MQGVLQHLHAGGDSVRSGNRQAILRQCGVSACGRLADLNMCGNCCPSEAHTQGLLLRRPLIVGVSVDCQSCDLTTASMPLV